MTEENILSTYISAQIAKPTRAVVNSESAFVAQNLRNNGYSDLARRYWNWVCSSKSNPIFGESISKLQKQLDNIDKQYTLDSSWTKGT